MPPKRNRPPGSTSTTHDSIVDGPKLAHFSRGILALENQISRSVFVEKLRDACSHICTSWGQTEEIEVDQDSLQVIRHCFRQPILMQYTTYTLIQENCIPKLVSVCKKVDRFPLKEWTRNPKLIDAVVERSYMILLEVMWIFQENVDREGVKDLMIKFQEAEVEEVFHRVLLGRDYLELGRALLGIKLLLPLGTTPAKQKLEPMIETILDLLLAFYNEVKQNKGGGTGVFQLTLSLVTEFSSNRHKPIGFYKTIIPCLQESLERFNSSSEDGKMVLKEVLWILSYISDEGARLPEVISESVVKAVARVLRLQEDPTRYPALRLIGNFCSGDDMYATWVIESGALEQLPKFLHDSSTQDSKVEALRIISNIAAGTRGQLMWLIDTGYVQETVRYLDVKVHYTVRREAIWVTKNLADVGLLKCIDFLVEECDFPRGFMGTLRADGTSHRRMSPVLASVYAVLCGDSWRDWLKTEGFYEHKASKEERDPKASFEISNPTVEEGHPQKQDDPEGEEPDISPEEIRELWVQKRAPPSVLKTFNILLEMELERDLLIFSRSRDALVAESAENALAWYRAVLGSTIADSSVPSADDENQSRKNFPDPDDEEFSRYAFHGRGTAVSNTDNASTPSLSLGPRFFFTETDTSSRIEEDHEAQLTFRLVAPYLIPRSVTVLGNVKHKGSSIFAGNPDAQKKTQLEKMYS